MSHAGDNLVITPKIFFDCAGFGGRLNDYDIFCHVDPLRSIYPSNSNTDSTLCNWLASQPVACMSFSGLVRPLDMQSYRVAGEPVKAGRSGSLAITGKAI